MLMEFRMLMKFEVLMEILVCGRRRREHYEVKQKTREAAAATVATATHESARYDSTKIDHKNRNKTTAITTTRTFRLYPLTPENPDAGGPYPRCQERRGECQGGLAAHEDRQRAHAPFSVPLDVRDVHQDLTVSCSIHQSCRALFVPTQVF